MSEQGGRYQRSTSGLIGALVVTLLVIAGFVVFRAVNREDLEIGPEPVDYLSSVQLAQEEGDRPVYPRGLPGGWIATSVDHVRGDRSAWGLGLLTGAGDFVGVRQEDSSVDDLLESYVDEEAEPGEPVEVSGSVAESWDSFEDAGGDLAYAAEMGGDTVLVYGSAPEAELLGFLELLTADPLR